MNAAGFPKRVTICEVGPRDGLQNEAVTVRTDDKVRYIDLLVAAGFSNIEVTSFVSPKAVPQLADAEAVFTQLIQYRPAGISSCVPNERGLERALAAGARAIAVFTAATDSFTHRNIGMTIDESLAAFEVVIKRAKADGVYVRASISTAFGCPFEGAVPVANVVRVAERLLALGADELSVADTIGVATPNQVFDVVGALAPRVPLERVGLHFHDTRGMGLANIMAGLQTGVAIVRCVRGRVGRLSVRARCDRQRRDRRRALPARRDGDRDRHRSRQGSRGFALHRRKINRARRLARVPRARGGGPARGGPRLAGYCSAIARRFWSARVRLRRVRRSSIMPALRPCSSSVASAPRRPASAVRSMDFNFIACPFLRVSARRVPASETAVRRNFTRTSRIEERRVGPFRRSQTPPVEVSVAN